MQAFKGIADMSSAATSRLLQNATQSAHIPAMCALPPEGVAETVRRASEYASDYVSEHPIAAAAIAAGVCIVAAPGLAAAPALGAAGFTANGVAAGSAAAAVQASTGNVAAGSTFAVAQSAAMGGYGVAAVHGAVQAAGVSIAGLGGVFLGRSTP